MSLHQAPHLQSIKGDSSAGGNWGEEILQAQSLELPPSLFAIFLCQVGQVGTLWRQPWSVTLEWRLLQVSPFWNNCLFSEEKINFQSAYFFKCSQAPCGLRQGLGEWSRQRGPVLVFLSSLYEAFCSPVCPVDWGKIPTIITNLREWVSSLRSKKLSLGNGQFARALVCYEHSCAFLLQTW